MTSATRKSAFLEGILAGLPFLFIGVPFGVLFGLVATEAGLSVSQTLWMSALVIAGAAQFTAIQLIVEAAPIWAVLATALAVNLRMAMYSASLQPHLGAASLPERIAAAYVNVDASFALGMLEFEERPERLATDKIAFFVGTMALMTPLWIFATYLGAVAGDAMPQTLPVGFAMPIMFLALTGPMLKTLAHLGAAVTSVIAALALSGLPSGTGILVAGILAMMVGAEIERRRGR